MNARRRVDIPLWIALILKSRNKCHIIPPDWLKVSYLKGKYDEEVKIPTKFSNLPMNWLEISKILLAKASDDLEDPSHQLRSIIQDLREIRLVKSRKGLKELNESNMQLNGLSLMEINEMRPFVLTVMNKLRKLHDTTVPEPSDDPQYDDEDEDEDDY